jgi:hypothetical protein
MRNMNRIKSLILALFSALLCLSCVPDLEVKVEFKESNYEIAVGETLDLNAELTVENSVETPKFSAPDETVGKFVSAGVFYRFYGVDYELLSCHGTVKKEDFQRLVRKHWGPAANNAVYREK